MKAQLQQIIRTIAVLSVVCCLAMAENKTRIIGGIPTSIARFPYMVQLKFGGDFFCGGALVSGRIIVTAAHCVYNKLPSQMTIVGGTSFPNRGGVSRRIAKIIVPKEFSIHSLKMDIAVVKLYVRMKGRHIRPIRLCTHPLKAGMGARISGWGVTDPKNTKPAPRLKTTIIRLITRSSCKKIYKDSLSKTMICGSVPGVRDSCFGDSGGPLVHNKELCGVVSWGIGCGTKQYPGVYTSIKAVRKFLKIAFRQLV